MPYSHLEFSIASVQRVAAILFFKSSITDFSIVRYAYEKVGKNVEATADFDKLIDAAPTEQNYIRVGNAKFLGFTVNAKKMEGREKEPVFPVFLSNSRILLIFINYYFNKAISINPNSIEAYQGRAAIYRAFSKIGDDKTKEAEADERKVAELKGK